MSTPSFAKKSLIFNVLEFLRDEIHSNQLPEGSKETLKVFIDGLAKVYFITSDEKGKIYSFDLISIFLSKEKSVTDDELHDAEHYKDLGNIVMKRGCYDKAVVHYTMAINLNCCNALYYYNRALAYFQVHNHLEAIQDCKRALELKSNCARTHGLLGSVYFKMENWKEAHKSFEKCLKCEPDNKIYKEKLKLVKKKIHIFSVFKLPHFAHLLSDVKNRQYTLKLKNSVHRKKINFLEKQVSRSCYEKAVSYYTRAVQDNFLESDGKIKGQETKIVTVQDSNLSRAHDILGLVHFYMHEYVEASRAFTRALAYDPYNERYKAHLRLVQNQGSNFEDALLSQCPQCAISCLSVKTTKTTMESYEGQMFLGDSFSDVEEKPLNMVQECDKISSPH